MDTAAIIQALRAEKEKLERVIAALEELQRTSDSSPLTPARKRRGRKSMDAKEREEVSRRMKRYWADRRQARRDYEDDP